MSILKVIGISKTYPGTKALDRVDFELKKGELHAIMGENGAGKSTLMNILAGVISSDSGDIFINDVKTQIKNPMDAKKLGIGIVFQELSLFPKMTVAENIFTNSQPNLHNFINFEEMYNQADLLLKEFGVELDARQKLSELSISEQQVVEIVRVLSLKPKVIILDEPTSALSEAETEKLFHIIEKLKKRDIAIIYISHRMKEIFQISDRISVLRDGELISTLQAEETDEKEIIGLMVGREVDLLFPTKSINSKRNTVLEVNKLSWGNKFTEISFHIKAGEILGVFGLMGAGRSELAQTIYGINKPTSGSIMLNGKKMVCKNAYGAIKNGIAYLTEDRKENGLYLDFDIKDNISMGAIYKMQGFYWDKKLSKKVTDEAIDRYKIKCSSKSQKVVSLSGGNQQKVLLSKVIENDPGVLIIDEPTRGVDVASKAEIHQHLREIADSGVAVMMISSEIPEIIGMSDRIITLCNGYKTGEFTCDEVSEEQLLLYSSKFEAL